MARGNYDPDDDLDDDAPWLAEGVREKSRGSTMVPRGRIVGGGLIALALVVLIGLGVFLISSRKQDGSTGFKRAEDAPLIAADPGPYKLAPTDPGGAAVAGISDSIAAAGRGDDAGGAIDLTALPEEPLARPGTVAEPPTDLLPPAKAAVPVAPTAAKITAPLPPPVKAVAAPVVAPVAKKPTAKPVKPPAADPPKTAKPDPLADRAPPKPAAKSAAGAALQLGAFSTEAKADAAWTTAVGHAPALGGLSKRIEPIERGGKTLYRLRAGGVASKAAADELCVKVKAGGDACLVAE